MYTCAHALIGSHSWKLSKGLQMNISRISSVTLGAKFEWPDCKKFIPFFNLLSFLSLISKNILGYELRKSSNIDCKISSFCYNQNLRVFAARALEILLKIGTHTYTLNQKSNYSTSYYLLHRQPWRSEAWDGQGLANLPVTIQQSQFFNNFVTQKIKSKFESFFKSSIFLEIVENWLIYNL